jgi:hypothetical protein
MNRVAKVDEARLAMTVVGEVQVIAVLTCSLRRWHISLMCCDQIVVLVLADEREDVDEASFLLFASCFKLLSGVRCEVIGSIDVLDQVDQIGLG